MAFGGFTFGAALLFLVAILCRLFLRDELDNRFPCDAPGLHAVPADALGFALFFASFLPGRLTWRGQDFSLRDHGVMTLAVEDEEAAAASQTAAP